MMVNTPRTLTAPFGISPRFVLFALAIALSACADQGCDCEGFVQAPFPEEHLDKTVPLGGQVRVTDTGLQFLGDQVPTLIEQVQPGGLSFCIPPTEGTVDICTSGTCADGSAGCQLDLAFEQSSLVPQPTDTLNAEVTIGGIGGTDANGDWNEEIDVRFALTDCVIRISEPGDSDAPGSIDATLPVTFTVDEQSPTRDVRIDIGEPQVEDLLDQVEVDIDGDQWFDVVPCETADAAKGLLSGTINDQITGTLNDTIAQIEAEQLCRACGDQAPACPGASTCGEQAGFPVCQYDDGSCVPAALGVQGELQLGALIGDFSENPDNGVSTLLSLSDRADVDTGLNLALRTGFQPTADSLCVPIDPTTRPAFDAIDPSASIYTDQRAGGGSFMVGIGLHKRAVEQALWSTWASGALCLQVSGAAIPELSPATLGLLLPSLKKLVDPDALVFIRLTPQQAPTVKLGANTVTPDGDTYAIDDPLLTIDWNNLDIHFYGYSQDRFLRLFSLRADLLIPVAIASDGQGSLFPLLGDLSDAVDNIRPIGTELLEEDPQRLIALVPTLVGQALPSLAGSLNQPIELPEFFGLAIGLEQDDITSVDANSMIALYADLVAVGQTQYVANLDTTIARATVDTSEWDEHGIPHPRATLDVFASTPIDALGGVSRDVEFSWRVNNGPWSMFRGAQTLNIQDPALVLQGRHFIDVRARYRGDMRSLELSPASVEVVVDYQAPELEIERQGSLVTLHARDVVDPQLEYRYRLVDADGGSAWTPWTTESTIDLAAIAAPARVRLIAQTRDDEGFVTEDEQNIDWDPHALPAPVRERLDGSPTAGCSAGGERSPVGPAGMLMLLGALALGALRRRRRALLVALTALALAGSTGCKDDDTSGTSNLCEPACNLGEECVDGTCQAVTECSMDDECGDCPDGQKAVCAEGFCECRAFCEAGCDDGQFCCNATDSCQDLPDPCADQLCDPGFEPSVVSQGTPDSATCEIAGAACECVSLPPLPLGNHGQYASVSQNSSVRAVSAYNREYGDLMVGVVAGDGSVDWSFVDGVPADGDIEGSLDGPRGGVGDDGPNVGTHTAIVVDDAGALHVFYRDEVNSALKYARGSADAAGYRFEVVEVDAQGDTGLYTDAALRDGAVHAVYAAREVPDADGAWLTQVRHVSFPADTPIADLALEPTVVHGDAAANPCGNDCAAGQECFLADAACVQQTGDCADTCGVGTECRDGACELIYEAPPAQYPAMVGLFNDLTLTDDGLMLVFHDNLNGVVGYTTFAEGAWADATFLAAPSGPYASGMLDSDGVVHLAYMDPTSRQLRYQQVGGAVETVITGVRDTVDGYLWADIGEDVHMRIKADGTVQLFFQDATWHKMHVATRAAADDWSVDTLTEPGDPYSGAHGLYLDVIQADPASSFAVEYVVNNQADPPTAAPQFPQVP